MSLGKNHQSSSSTQQATSNQTLDPTIMSWLGSNLQRAQGVADAPYQPYTGQRVADFNPQQQQAFGLLGDISTNQTGAGLLNQGADAANGVANYASTPVTTQNLSGIDLSGYTNPWENDVVGATQADMNRQLGTEQANSAARATAAGAFGGSRDALVGAETNRNFNQSIAQTIAQLRSQGYTQAQNLAEQDLNRRAGVDTGNQTSQNQAAQLRLGGAGLLGQLSDQQLNQAQTRASLLGQSGAMQQQNQQQQLDALYEAYQNGQIHPTQMQALLNQALGLAGNPTLTSSQSTGTSTGSGSGWTIGTGGGGGDGGGVAALAQMFA